MDVQVLRWMHYIQQELAIRGIYSDILTHRLGCTINVRYQGVIIEHLSSAHVTTHDLINWWLAITGREGKETFTCTTTR